MRVFDKLYLDISSHPGLISKLSENSYDHILSSLQLFKISVQFNFCKVMASNLKSYTESLWLRVDREEIYKNFTLSLNASQECFQKFYD